MALKQQLQAHLILLLIVSLITLQLVENHKWVIHEELEGPGEAPLEPGTEVTLDADHMKGMDGATAVIESAEDTTVYMLDFTTTTGEKVENHKWVTESELSPVE